MRPSILGRFNFPAALAALLLAMCGGAYAQDPTEGEEALNIQLVGYDDLQGRSADDVDAACLSSTVPVLVRQYEALADPPLRNRAMTAKEKATATPAPARK